VSNIENSKYMVIACSNYEGKRVSSCGEMMMHAFVDAVDLLE